MKKITGADAATNLNGVNAQRTRRSAAARSETAKLGLKRSTDGVNISGTARAVAGLSDVAEVRTEMVNRLSREVHDPDYDVDAKLSQAMDRLFGDVFAS